LGRAPVAPWRRQVGPAQRWPRYGGPASDFRPGVSSLRVFRICEVPFSVAFILRSDL